VVARVGVLAFLLSLFVSLYTPHQLVFCSARKSTLRAFAKKEENGNYIFPQSCLNEPSVSRRTVISLQPPVVETAVLWKLGDLVWAYVPGHPLWPCMITDHPEEEIFTKMHGLFAGLFIFSMWSALQHGICLCYNQARLHL